MASMYVCILDSSIPLLTVHRNYVLVTGATGFIGAHVVDSLLKRGIRVRGATRQMSKGEEMIKARPQFAAVGLLDFVQIRDFQELGVFEDAVKGVDGIIHVASVSARDGRTTLEF